MLAVILLELLLLSQMESTVTVTDSHAVSVILNATYKWSSLLVCTVKETCSVCGQRCLLQCTAGPYCMYELNGVAWAGMQTLHYSKHPGKRGWWQVSQWMEQGTGAVLAELHMCRICIPQKLATILTKCSNSFALLLFPNNAQHNLQA